MISFHAPVENCRVHTRNNGTLGHTAFRLD